MSRRLVQSHLGLAIRLTLRLLRRRRRSLASGRAAQTVQFYRGAVRAGRLEGRRPAELMALLSADGAEPAGPAVSRAGSALPDSPDRADSSPRAGPSRAALRRAQEPGQPGQAETHRAESSREQCVLMSTREE